MSNTKHEVTVYDRVPATAAVSVAQVDRYLERTGWTVRSSDEKRGIKRWGMSECRVWTGPYQDCIPMVVDTASAIEQRQPSAVLADIEREPES